MKINIKQIFWIFLAALISSSMTFAALAAKVSVPGNVRWEGTKACWDEAEDAYQYEVQLYRNGDKYSSSVNTSSTSVDMSGYMREKGRYTFRVRVRDRISDEYGSYSSESSVYVQEKDQTPRKNTGNRTTTTPASTTGKTEKNPGPGAVGDGWRQSGNRWWYRNEDGTYPAGCWSRIDQKWYYFDAEGYMQTGWIVTGERQYYCLTDGSMVVGWLELNNAYFYFDENGVYQK